MVTINVFTSAKNKDVVSELTRRLPSGTKENVIARIALAYSLSTERRFLESEFNLYDSGGKEYKDSILFDPVNKPYFLAMICQAYMIDKDNDIISKYVKLHIDHGLELLDEKFKENEDYTFYDFIMTALSAGVDALDVSIPSPDPVSNPRLNISKSIYSGPINIKVGYKKVDHEEIFFCFNNTNKYSNPHIAVAGKSGSGKTQFALEFLHQLHSKTNGKVNFLFMDFKGLSVDDQRKMSSFFTETETSFVNAPDVPFPFNPLSFIDVTTDKNLKLGINKFVDIIANYAKIGKAQAAVLKEAVKASFDNADKGKFPSMSDIYNNVFDSYDKRDTLTEILEKLCEYNVFDSDITDPTEFLNKNHYFSLSSGLDETLRFTSVFLVLNYISTIFANMGTADNVDGYQSMRYVLMIDEAHALFANKKSHATLENMLRVMRSFGVSVFLLSQGIQEYNQGTFDFSQECESAFLLPIKDNANVKAISKFLGFSDKESVRITNQLDKLENGYAISNMKEFAQTENFEVVQYWRESQIRSKN